MALQKPLLAVTLLLAIAGWASAGVLALTLRSEKDKLASTERVASDWRRKAGKAYMEVQRMRAGDDSPVILMPVGSRLECSDGQAKTHCADGYTLYPPKDY